VLAKFLPRKEFVCGSFDRERWAKRQTESFRRQRSDVRGPIANGGDSIKGSARDDLLNALIGFVKAQRDGVVSPWIVEDVASIRGEDEFAADLLCNLRKCARLITGSRGYKQNAHTWLLAGDFDSQTNFRLLVRGEAPHLAAVSPADQDVSGDSFKRGVRLEVALRAILIDLRGVSFAQPGIEGFKVAADFLPRLLKTDWPVRLGDSAGAV